VLLLKCLRISNRAIDIVRDVMVENKQVLGRHLESTLAADMFLVIHPSPQPRVPLN